MQQAAATLGLPPLGGVTDIRPLIRDTATPAGLDSHDLHRVAETLNATAHIARWTADLPAELELIQQLATRVSDFSVLAGQIDRAIDARGRVRDEASSRLTSVRRLISEALSRIDHLFDRLVREPRVVRFLQYPGATFHDDRRVLPVKAEQRGQIKGIIHRSSDTGATLFIEPAEAVALNNDLLALKEDEQREIARILSDLSVLVHHNAEAILTTLDAIGVLDLVAAKVRYARKYDAVCPEIVESRVLRLYQARHPVLIDLAHQAGDETGSKVVPIDVRLGDDFDLLVITGPNTGGKTVALKTVGLLVLAAQSGIPIPAAAGSQVPVYRQVHIDVGDEQSIEQSLSTFSSHLAHVLHVFRHANSEALVLLDEVGSGTDPDEGAAIGRAIIEELQRIGCSAILTTHLSALKAVAFTQTRVDNASVEFDVESLRPTYRLRIGEPGNSNALTIAQRLGMPRRLINRAQKYLSGRDQALKQAIAGTLESRRDAERARIDAQKALLDYEQQRIHYQREVRKLEDERAAHLKWVEWVNALSPGREVYVRKFERAARVVRMQLHKQTALVSTGSMEMELHLNELSPMP